MNSGISSCAILTAYPKFDSYLAGLIEGDGSIKTNLVNKVGKPLTPTVTITFTAKDLPLVQKIAKLLDGTINKGSGNWYILSIYKQSALHNLASLINGKFRTPKIEALHSLIIWLNGTGKFHKLDLLPLDTSDINSNAWLAGFSDSDGHFLISFKLNSSICKEIHLRFRLSQRQVYHKISSLTGTSYLPVLSSIANAFHSKVTSYIRTRTAFVEKGYLVSILSKLSRSELINYFNQFPLLSSKHLDFLAWKEADSLVCNRKYRSLEGSSKLVSLKESMNTKRTEFNWSYLDSYFK